jgi:hypothetical protein
MHSSSKFLDTVWADTVADPGARGNLQTALDLVKEIEVIFTEVGSLPSPNILKSNGM